MWVLDEEKEKGEKTRKKERESELVEESLEAFLEANEDVLIRGRGGRRGDGVRDRLEDERRHRLKVLADSLKEPI